jgi:predicted peptidase
MPAGQPIYGELSTVQTRSVKVRYFLSVPNGPTHRRLSKEWPLILFLHGSGERGEDLKKVAKHGPPKLALRDPDFPFMVLAPQCPRTQLWSPDIILALLDHVLEEHPADPYCVYLTGLSMGGYTAWQLAAARPDLFAAVAPICGGGDILPIKLAEPGHARLLRQLPVWAFHGAKDPVVPMRESERMIAALRDIGNEAKLTIYPEAGHDAWTEAYAGPELYDWFLQHRRLAQKRSKPSH